MKQTNEGRIPKKNRVSGLEILTGLLLFLLLLLFYWVPPPPPPIYICIYIYRERVYVYIHILYTVLLYCYIAVTVGRFGKITHIAVIVQGPIVLQRRHCLFLSLSLSLSTKPSVSLKYT